MSGSKWFVRELHDDVCEAIVPRRDDGAASGRKFDGLIIEFERLRAEFEGTAPSLAFGPDVR